MIKRITLSESATDTIINAAVLGYEARYKEEQLGILLGLVSSGIALVKRAVVYRGGERTRTSASVDPYKFEQRVNTLQEESGLDFLGSFHTHNEINGSISSALSEADKTPLCDDPPSLIEIIAAIWANNASVRPSRYYFQGGGDGYRYRFAGYDYQRGFRILPVYSRIAY
jgi:hypothetical protein